MAEDAAPEQPKKKSKKVIFVAAIAVGVALLQGGAFFLFMKLMGSGPTAAVAATPAAQAEAPGAPPAGEHGAKPAEAPSAAESDSTEVVLLQRLRVPNSKSGPTIIYDMDISVVVATKGKAAFEETLKSRAAEISDRVAQVIRGAPARVLSEDDLGSLRRLIKGTLGEIIGDEDTIQRVLIPRCVPMRVD